MLHLWQQMKYDKAMRFKAWTLENNIPCKIRPLNITYPEYIQEDYVEIYIPLVPFYNGAMTMNVPKHDLSNFWNQENKLDSLEN